MNLTFFLSCKILAFFLVNLLLTESEIIDSNSRKLPTLFLVRLQFFSYRFATFFTHKFVTFNKVGEFFRLCP